jgi:Histidine kinase-like ATPase domain
MIVGVSHEQVACDRRVLRIRLAAEPASVPGARRFVADGLRAWGHDALVDDASLCVSELAGNAALHGGSTYIEVCVLNREKAVRLWVEDDGPTPAAAIAPRTSLPVPDLEPGVAFDAGSDDLVDFEGLLNAPATGRGLAIVSVLASDWGVEELENGKRVWADLSPVGADGQAVPPKRGTPPSVRRTASPAEDPGAQEPLPDGWTVVTLAGCPVELSLLQDQHLDELVRELTLIGAGRDDDATELAHRLEAILRAPAHARDAGRRQTKAALARGEAFVDVKMAMPRAFSHEVSRLQDAVRQADALCEEARLLTLASRPEIRELREWMTAEIMGQIEHDAPPTSWLDWLARR